MLDLAAYETEITYTLELAGIDEIVEDEATVTLTVSGAFALDAKARQAMGRLAVMTRQEPLQVMEEIAAEPLLLLKLADALGADLDMTLALLPKAVEFLEADSDTPVPAAINLPLRFVDGVLYVNIAQLKALDESLAGTNDWIAYEVLALLERAAEDGVFTEAAAAATTVVAGGAPGSASAGMLSLLARASATFGKSRVLEQYMTIERAEDAELENAQAGAVFTTKFDVLDFVLSDDFRELLLQMAEVYAASEGENVGSEVQQGLAMFWFVAPALFRDLAVEGSTTVGTDDKYVHAGQAIFDWDLTALLRLLADRGELPGRTAEHSYIRLTVRHRQSRIWGAAAHPAARGRAAHAPRSARSGRNPVR